jgi:hypothetical protein
VLSYDPWELSEEAVFLPLPPPLTSRVRVVSGLPHSSSGAAAAAALASLASHFASLGAALRNGTSTATAAAAPGGNATCDWAAFSALADADSFVSFFLLTEWAQDPDACAPPAFRTMLALLAFCLC